MYIVYGGEGCGYCVQAKKLLESKKGVEFEYKDIYDKVPSGEGTHRDELFELMGKMNMPLPRSIPQIFVVNGGEMEYIGGYDNLREYLGG